MISVPDRALSERLWIERKLATVELKFKSRPSAIKEIRELKYQMRRCDLEIAFNGPDWERYAIWEMLTR